ncbi:MAG: hypothetical protein A3K65_06710 [Euryarchaeota archaeon RBG_16_68_12]|nr:MAG: hypothetical protein A3K65_06710 [Euryarchaeota archaeon RBG_16_68_12]
MVTVKRLAPPFSLVFVMDPSTRDIPQGRVAPILANQSCISIGCLAEIDGETEIRLGWDDEVDPGTPPAFVGTLETPTRVVSVRTAEDMEILSLRIDRPEARVRVWTNHQNEPDLVIIGVSGTRGREDGTTSGYA